MSTTELSGGAALARALQAHGVAFVFGIAGGKLGPFMHAVQQTPGLRYVGVRNEAAAGPMAAAIYAASGALAVAMGEAGPGGAYLAAGVAHAFNNNLALLAITSNNQQAASYPGRGMFMEQNNAALFRPITKWNAAVHTAARLPELVHEACRHALTGRPGPVHLDIPQDILAARHDFPQSPCSAPGRSRADSSATETAARALAGARRPLLIAGGGVIRSGADHSFCRLATRLNAAVTVTQMALGAVPPDLPGFVGQGGIIGGQAVIRAMRDADVVLAVGCRFSSWLWDDQGPLVRPPQTLIHCDIDPVMIGRATPASVALVGDARAVLDDLCDALGTTPPGEESSAWLAECAKHRGADIGQLAALARDDAEPMHPAALAAALADAMPADALLCLDGGHTSFWTNSFARAAAPRTCFHDPGLAQLGFGLPYGIALALLHPDRPVLNVTGDGSFGFTLAELDTARRYGANVVTIIHNNASWGVIARSQSMQGFALGCELHGTDYAAIARGFGCHGETVRRAADVRPALDRALNSGLPAVLDCITRFEPHPCLPDFGRMGRYHMTGKS